ncbi:iron-containing alcohol dehydrogenase [Chakrabartyella piscis]|uniref:iron-containing alcohol dehydrogenase n=1 Tax=Chakrabartyella piscis TaxID=2918914 RepID=UPI002958CA84|nr:iron-containing alcohol dehydrogenase [Chakrabartyella piscis]
MNIFKQIYCRTFQTCFKIALPILPYREPDILDDVEKIADILTKNNVNTVLMVIDKNIRRLELSKRLEDSLKDNQIQFHIYEDTVQNPTITNVLEAKKIYLDNHCSAIIGFGGGSAMDCAKCVGASIARPNLSIPKMNGILKIMKKTPLFFAVPTTAGTGSEVTITSVITDEVTKQKYTINDFPLIPDYAVLDYTLTFDLPDFITSTTGMDVLTHAVESYIGNTTTKHTREMAEDAVVLVKNHLLTAYLEPHNIEARKSMQIAAYKAGVAFSRSYVGYVHAISHALSGRYHTLHGLANACILPYFLDEYGAVIDEKLAKLADVISLCDTSLDIHTKANAFRSWVWDMNKQLHIPDTLEEIQVEDIPKLVYYADKEANPLYPVPVLMDKDKLATMIHKFMK